MRILFFYNSTKSSFLINQLGINDIYSLRIPIKTYKDKISDELFDLSNFDSVFFNTEDNLSFSSVLMSLSEYSQQEGCTFEVFDKIVFYDVNNFPLDSKKISSIVNKLPYNDEAMGCYFLNDHKKKKFSGIFCLNYKEVNDYANSLIDVKSLSLPSTTIDISNMILPLDEPSNVLRLFASNFELRHFNSIQDDGCYFLKSSQNISKLKEEYRFLSTIDNTTKPFYPQVGACKEDRDSFSYQIEKVYSLDASKLLINGTFSNQEYLTNFLKSLKSYLKCVPRQEVRKTEFLTKIRKTICDKNISRVNDIKELPQFEVINSYCISALGFDLFKYCEVLNAAILENIKGGRKFFFHACHGDLCLANILFNTSTSQIKLIDPRGGEDYSRMPLLYDLAKLSHSFNGLYDYIVSDLFQIQLKNNLDPEVIHFIEPEFRKRLEIEFKDFVNFFDYDYKLIRLVESSLFLSMIPLHKESPHRMFAQIINSITIFKSIGV